MKRIEFTKAYAIHKKGDIVERDGMLARILINLGVAKMANSKSKAKRKA